MAAQEEQIQHQAAIQFDDPHEIVQHGQYQPPQSQQERLMIAGQRHLLPGQACHPLQGGTHRIANFQMRRPVLPPDTPDQYRRGTIETAHGAQIPVFLLLQAFQAPPQPGFRPHQGPQGPLPCQADAIGVLNQDRGVHVLNAPVPRRGS